MAFTDLHEIREEFARLTTAIAAEDYAGYVVRESVDEHVARTQRWRAENPGAYRRLLDAQNERRREERGFVALTAEERAARKRDAARAYNASERGRAVNRARAKRYEADPVKLEAKRRDSREWKRRNRAVTL